MEKLLLVGAGGFGRVVLEHAANLYDCAFLDDGEKNVVDGVPVIGKTDEIGSFYPEYQLLLVTIGNNTLREKLVPKRQDLGLDVASLEAEDAVRRGIVLFLADVLSHNPCQVR